MTLTIRLADGGDLTALEALRVEATEWLAGRGLDQWQPGQPRARSRRGLAEIVATGTCYVVEYSGSVIATVTLDSYADPEFWGPDEATEPALYVHRMIVSREFAGQGIGALLLAWAEHVARRDGVMKLRLDAWATNLALHRYYKAQGFTHVRTVRLPHRGSGALFERSLTTSP